MGYPSENEHLNQFEIGLDLKIWNFLRLLLFPHQPLVMINMLVYKEKATGDFAHLSGEQAYEIYAKAAEKALAPAGARLLWSGSVLEKWTDAIAPVFNAIGLLEYPSPRAFFTYALKSGSEAKARAAGLEGQWLIAASTHEEDQAAVSTEGEQIILVELWGGVRNDSQRKQDWEKIRSSRIQSFGAQTIWSGQCDLQLMGAAHPIIESCSATSFPDATELKEALTAEKAELGLGGPNPYLAYVASSLVGFLPDLSEY